MILDETADYAKVSILKWDKRVVNLEKKENSPFLRAMLAMNAKFMERFDFDFTRTINEDVTTESSDSVVESPISSRFKIGLNSRSSRYSQGLRHADKQKTLSRERLVNS